MKRLLPILALLVLMTAARSFVLVTLQAGDSTHCAGDVLVQTSSVDADCVFFTPTPTPTATGVATATPLPTATATLTPTPSPVLTYTLDLSVTASADDATQQDNGASFSSVGHLVIVASDTFSYNRNDNGTRFVNVSVPQGAVITRAYWSGSVYNVTSPVRGNIYAEAVDNSPSFSTNPSVVNRARTSAFVLWQASLPVGYNNSPELKSVIQEVVNRTGWTSGNALTILQIGVNASPYQSVLFLSFDHGASVPRLHIEYTVN